MMLFNFIDDPDAAHEWRVINDTVMGGVSESTFEPTNTGAAFHGTVSLAHGGGFASVRAPTGAYDLSKAAGLQVHLRGDGKRYMWTLYTHPGGRISYRISFDAPTEWTMLTLPFDACEPYRRGRRVPGAPPFDASQVRTMGLLIGDKQDGSFRLDLQTIAAPALPASAV